MATVERLAGRPRQPAGAAARGWGWPQYLALLALPVLALEAYTIASWLLDGPHMVTEYRDGSRTTTWWAARAFEGGAILVSAAVIVQLVKGCRRAGRLLTFDVMICLAGATLFWVDAGLNVFQPFIVISAEWVNVNNVCGHIPGVVNPDCGRVPDPILFLWLMETFCTLGAVMVFEAIGRRVTRRWPGLSPARVFVVLTGLGMVLVLLEPLAIIATGLWGYPGSPLSLPIGDLGLRYPAPELLAFALYFAVMAALRFFKNDQGHTLLERGLERYSPRVRGAITLLAVYTVFQFAAWGPGTAALFPLAFHQQEWDELPAHLNAGVCDQPSVGRTRYGPCPGTPGWRMPMQESGLPGRSP